jgi:hypothetical protein
MRLPQKPTNRRMSADSKMRVTCQAKAKEASELIEAGYE